MSYRPARARRVGGARGVVVATCVLAVTLAACSAEPKEATGGDSSEGVPAGASKEEYAAALADMEPVTLTLQTPTPAENPVTQAYEAYADAVTEWSGGAIKFEFAYASSAAGATEIFNALADGRLDMSYTAPTYDPTIFSAHDALLRLTHLGKHDAVVGMLQANAAFLETAFETPKILAEYEQQGTVALLPYYPTDQNGFACTQPRTSLDQMDGAQTRISARVHAEQVRALGMSPTSLPFTEAFEGLQRGVVDCAMFPLFGAQFTQLLTVASEFVIDTEVSTSVGMVGLGMGKAQWDGLPLAAQQLLHDRLDVLIENAILHNIWQTEVAGLATIEEQGGAVRQFDQDVREALSDVNEKIVDGVRTGNQVPDGEAFVDRVVKTLDKWEGIVRDAGFTEPVSYENLADWYPQSQPDLGPYLEQVVAEILKPSRPG